MPKLLGKAPNQVPTNADLGSMAFQDREGINVNTALVANLVVTGATSVNTTFAVTNATSNVAFFASNGNIGIQTSAPIWPLQVNANVAYFGAFNTTGGTSVFVDSPSAQTAAIIFRQAGGNAVDIGTRKSNTSVLTIRESASGAERVTFVANSTLGAIGINNTAPDASLTITGTANISGNVATGGTYLAFSNNPNTVFTSNATHGVAIARGSLNSSQQLKIVQSSSGHLITSYSELNNQKTIVINATATGNTAADYGVTVQVESANRLKVNNTITTISSDANITGNTTLLNATISGNLTVSGTTTYINTTQLNIGDNIISLNADLSGATAPTENAGIEVNRGSSANVSMFWDESNKRWTYTGEGANNWVYVTTNSLTRSSLINSSGMWEYWGNTSTAAAFAEFSVFNGVNRFDSRTRDYLIANTTANSFNFAANGNFGVGNTTPAEKLTVTGTMSVANATNTGLLFVAANGNVGINTTAPNGKFIVNSDAGVNRSIRYDGGSFPTFRIRLGDNGIPSPLQLENWAMTAVGQGTSLTATLSTDNTTAYNAGQIIFVGEGDYLSGANASAAMQFRTSSGNNLGVKMHIGANGNVGIGTVTPGEKLSISGTVAARVASNTAVVVNYLENSNTGTGVQTIQRLTSGADKSLSFVVSGGGFSGMYGSATAPSFFYDFNTHTFRKLDGTGLATFAANGNIGFGNGTPTGAKMVIESSVNTNDPTLLLRNVNASSAAISSLSIRGDTAGSQLDMGVVSSTYGGYGLATANGAYILSKSVNGLGIFADNASSYLRFGAGGTSEHARLNANGGFYVGTTGDLYGRQWQGIYNKNHNATTQLGVINSNTGASAEARFTLITGTGNSFMDWGLNDSAGSPTSTMAYGSAVGVAQITLSSGTGVFRVGNTGTVALHVSTANGNVGIGNTTPTDKLVVNGNIFANNLRRYPVQRTLTTTANDTVEIGTLYAESGAHSLDITIQVTDGAFSVTKRYLINSPWNATGSATYRKVLPAFDSGPFSSNDYDLEAYHTNQTLGLRVRRTAGAVTGTLEIMIEDKVLQSETTLDYFTPSSTAASGVAAVTDIFPGSRLLQTGFGAAVSNSFIVVANTTVNAITSNNTITAFNLPVSFGSYTALGSSAFVNIGLTTSATTANQVLSTYSATGFRTAKFIVQITSGSVYQATEITLIHDGTTVYKSEYGQVFSGAVLATFDADINSGNVRLLTTPTNAVTVYKGLATQILI